MNTAAFFGFFDAHPWAWPIFALVTWYLVTGIFTTVYDRWSPRTDAEWADLLARRPRLGALVNLARTSGWNLPGMLRSIRTFITKGPPWWLVFGRPREVANEVRQAAKEVGDHAAMTAIAARELEAKATLVAEPAPALLKESNPGTATTPPLGLPSPPKDPS